MDRKSIDSSLAIGVQQATKAAVTIWPILFAAVISQSLKAIATYKVERGIRVMTLEQLIGSHSVASAIKQPFLLQRPDLLTIGLTALWALSPLASQALLRWSYEENLPVNRPLTVSYLDTLQDNYGLQSVDFNRNQTGWNKVDGYLAPMDELFMAAFLSVSEYGPDDDWGNPMIPVYEDQPGSPDAQGFVAVTGHTYASFFGIPMTNDTKIPDSGTTDILHGVLIPVFRLPGRDRDYNG